MLVELSEFKDVSRVKAVKDWAETREQYNKPEKAAWGFTQVALVHLNRINTDLNKPYEKEEAIALLERAVKQLKKSR